MAVDDPDASASPLDEEARAWVRRIRSGEATGRDARLLRQWCARSTQHSEAFARARQEWHDIGGIAATYQRLYPASSSMPHRAAVAATAALPDPRRRWMLGAGLSAAGAAAVVAAIHPPLALWPSWSELAADYRTGTGQQAKVALSDHVELTLNTQTSLAVQGTGGEAGEAGEGGDRVRLIAGEASVQRGAGARPVELLAGNARIVPGVGSVEVRRADDERYCVTCTEGRAEVLHTAGSNVALREGERVWYGPAGLAAVTPVDMEQALAWRRGVVVFRGTPLSEAVAEINRYRAGRVVLANESLAGRRLSGHFRISALDEAIVQIEKLFGAHVTRLPAGVVLLA
ncbi:iron dicitrate transport regulator FecR [Variovorax sp. KBW07]|uniref:FecR family protein n=1 Tax=Variovorax sp. KBW07 TaxID=2153358 RepID=UPI000F564147|nr:FecR domain-containing protein [Variovorax sp. KBW07]RQO63793.1 iron dicitrate transport regulator FecR [Variovorax sp. KBW07]